MIMNAKEFIHAELLRFVEAFTEVRVRYEYDSEARVHTVEVLPKEIYHSDAAYIRWEDDFYRRFVDRFPMESICFVSEDALAGIDNPEFVLEGIEYAKVMFQQTKGVRSELHPSVRVHC